MGTCTMFHLIYLGTTVHSLKYVGVGVPVVILQNHFHGITVNALRILLIQLYLRYQLLDVRQPIYTEALSVHHSVSIRPM